MNRPNKNTGSAAPECIHYLDTLRFLAISMVILIHVISGVADTIPHQMTAVQLNVYKIIKELCTPGVPLFLMISGALFLAPEKSIPLAKLFGKYIRRILLALVLFGTFYAFIELVATKKTFAPIFLLEAFYQMLIGNSWAHMWYLYALLGLYLFLPLLKTFTANADEKIYRYALILLFIANSLFPFLEKSFQFHIGIEFPTAGIYLFYYLCGYYLHHGVKESKSKIRCSILILSASWAVILLDAACSLGLDMQYDSPVVVLSSASLFFLAKCQNRAWRLCSAWREYYFAMYLIHTFFLNVAYKFLNITPLIGGGYVLLPIFWMGTFLLSLLGAWVLRKIPFLKKYVL